jgi:hypothetical protein
VEVGSNTSTVALRIVEGHENGTRYLGVYNWAILSLGDINRGTWSSRLGVSRKVDDLALQKENNVAKSKDVETGRSLRESFKERCGSRRAILPLMTMMIMMIMIRYFD